MNEQIDINEEWEMEQATFRGRTDALLTRMKLLREQAEQNNPQRDRLPDVD